MSYCVNEPERICFFKTSKRRKSHEKSRTNFFSGQNVYPQAQYLSFLTCQKSALSTKQLEIIMKMKKELKNLTFSKRFRVLPAPQKSRISNSL